VPEQLISASSAIAIAGSTAYGTTVHPAQFNPPCDAYREAGVPDVQFPRVMHTTGSDAQSVDGSGTYANMSMHDLVTSHWKDVPPMQFFANVTNQPIFGKQLGYGNGSVCDKQVRYFNTSLTDWQFAGRPVKGRVDTNMGPLAGRPELASDMLGYEVASQFAEYNLQDCQYLQGYTGPAYTGFSSSEEPEDFGRFDAPEH
jgi:hypothetical protein